MGKACGPGATEWWVFRWPKHQKAQATWVKTELLLASFSKGLLLFWAVAASSRSLLCECRGWWAADKEASLQPGDVGPVHPAEWAQSRDMWYWVGQKVFQVFPKQLTENSESNFWPIQYLKKKWINSPQIYQHGSDGKESACNAGDLGLILGSGRSPGEGASRLPNPIFFPGESHGQRSLVGCSPWAHKESDMTEQLILILSNLPICCFRLWVLMHVL